MSKKILKLLKNIIMTIAMPVLVFAFFKIISIMIGYDGFGVNTDFTVIIYNTIFTGMIALALAYNLTSGRFDFSIGSVLILAAIISGNIAKDYDFVGMFGPALAPVAMLLLAMIVGAICGLISGLIYIWLRVPPMILSIGLAMIYEAVGFALNNGRGTRVSTEKELLVFSKQPYILIIVILVIVVLGFVINYTKFGFNTNALRNEQQIAVNVGIKEKKNAIICYIIAGILLGIASVIYLSQYGNMAPKTGLASSAFLMDAFLPIFIGGAIAKYSDFNIGIIVGAFVQATIYSGFVALGFGTQLQSVLSGVIVMLFLIYSSNRYKIVEFQMFKAKAASALVDRKNRELKKGE